MSEVLEYLFPGLAGKPYRVTSPFDEGYNCLAWAIGDSERWWWPSDAPKCHWPEAIPRELTIQGFRRFFALHSFVEATSETLEPGIEKIALFVNATGQPTHVARQLPNQRWTSKLGMSQDIEHDLHDLEGTA